MPIIEASPVRQCTVFAIRGVFFQSFSVGSMCCGGVEEWLRNNDNGEETSAGYFWKPKAIQLTTIQLYKS